MFIDLVNTCASATALIRILHTRLLRPISTFMPNQDSCAVIAEPSLELSLHTPSRSRASQTPCYHSVPEERRDGLGRTLLVRAAAFSTPVSPPGLGLKHEFAERFGIRPDVSGARNLPRERPPGLRLMFATSRVLQRRDRDPDLPAVRAAFVRRWTASPNLGWVSGCPQVRCTRLSSRVLSLTCARSAAYAHSSRAAFGPINWFSGGHQSLSGHPIFAFHYGP